MRLRRFCYALVSEFVWFTGVVVGGWLRIGWWLVGGWLDEFVFCGMSSGWLAWLAYGESASCALLV